MPIFGRALGSDECAVVLRRHGDPLLIRGPGSIRTFYRWRQVSIVSLIPFAVDVVDTNVTTNDGVAMTVRGELQAQVIDPVAAAVKVVDYEHATRMVLQTAMRALVMKRSSAELNEGRQVNPAAADEVVDAARSWGVAASSVTFDVAVATGR
jgi:regulator of protease activity HflC (stomatin/prohibitin superfamily)